MKDDFFKQYPYLCDTFFISKNTEIEKDEAAAEELISPYRLDFMAKLLWIEALEGKADQAQADQLYEAHLLAFSNGLMIEPGQAGKKGLERYCAAFSRICAGMREAEGELVKLGDPIPVDGKHMPMDGAHRISAAIYYKKRLPVYRVHKVIPNKYDYRFFQKRYLDEAYILMMVETYVSMRNCRLYMFEKKMDRGFCRRVYKECAPVYMKKVISGELLLVVDCGWIEKSGKAAQLDSWLGDHYVKETDAILGELAAWREKLLIHENGYACKKRMGTLGGRCWNRFRTCVKRLLGRPV